MVSTGQALVCSFPIINHYTMYPRYPAPPRWPYQWPVAGITYHEALNASIPTSTPLPSY